jgi:mono/diheme cytochrome c family protein
MKKFVTFVGAMVLVLGFVSGMAFARPAYKKDLGAENCATCHLEDKKAPNPANKDYKVSKEMADKMKEGKGAFAGKTACADCHKGQMKPAK